MFISILAVLTVAMVLKVLVGLVKFLLSNVASILGDIVKLIVGFYVMVFKMSYYAFIIMFILFMVLRIAIYFI